ncbi:hypothetical protein KBI52_18830 [Microvirga sp. HBU67558]|uniref:hypothetical protein n=1 Tax=Microvirga TaxID=186650 RepID=UPI001B38D5EE|nr:MULTISPECIES: hypothetical protein [unclassified Microvirga]MBQ0822247.1 hypothetical protein [Microvirga sp. HBU67558]
MRRQDHCHQKAKVSGLDFDMSKAPKRPRQRDSLRQPGDVAGSQPPKSSNRKPRVAPKRNVDTVSDSMSAELARGAMEGPEGSSVPSGGSKRGDPLARDRSFVAKGNQNVSDQQSPHSGVEDEQSVQTVALADDYGPTGLNQGIAGGLPQQTSEGAEIPANVRQESTQHHLIASDPEADSGGDDEDPSRMAAEATSDRVRNAPGRVKVWTQEGMAGGIQMNQQTDERANPIYILAAITLGIPALLTVPLIGLNPGVQEGTFTTVLGFVLLSAFVTAVVFEIKRLVDQPSDADHH